MVATYNGENSMKYFVLLVAAFFLMTSALSAEEPEVKWQVDVTIRYNAVSKGEATEIVKWVMNQNEEACTATVAVKKVGEDNDSGILITGQQIDGRTWLTTTPGVMTLQSQIQ